jgi:phosphoglycerate kinase
MTSFLTLDDINVTSHFIFVRADLNLPIVDGKVTDETRLVRLLPTLKELIAKKAKIILASHLGRPKGKRSAEDSLKILVPLLQKHLAAPIYFIDDCIGYTVHEALKTLQDGEILLLENLRFYEQEEKNDPVFSKSLSELADFYVNDAFSCSHRAHASIVGITDYLPAIAGRGMQEELEALKKSLQMPERPVMAIVGGAKVSTKLAVLKNLTEKVDYLVVGGGMANTFLAAKGIDIGASLCEWDMLKTAQEILEQSSQSGCQIILPQDAVVCEAVLPNAPSRNSSMDEISPQDRIVDMGVKSVHYVISLLKTCRTLLWNGPVGVFEILPFDKGTVALAIAIADLTKTGKLISVAGGGDTVSALVHAKVESSLSYVSTAGGAFLEWLEGKTLPGIVALEKEYKKQLLTSRGISR